MSGFIAAIAGSSGITLLDTQTVTKGTTSSGSDPITQYTGQRSAPLSPTCGSISDGTSNVYSGAAISGCYFLETAYLGQIGARQVIWRIASEVANSGWSTMLVDVTTFARADATFTTGTGYSQWLWSLPIPDPYVSTGDPFISSTTVKWY